jgi:NAD(P)-dependent dehydrogenase (short-subunit alcohol dehydrogenase family)
MAEMLKATPVGRLGLAQEVAKVAAFALSDQASFLSGIDLLVDGGLVAGISALGR